VWIPEPGKVVLPHVEPGHIADAALRHVPFPVILVVGRQGVEP
jgi:hypothetical protein